MDQKLKYLLITTITALIIFISGFWIYDYFHWKPIIEKQNSFIETWGTYNYNDFNDYPQRVRPYVSDQIFADYFGDEESMAIQAGKLVAKQYAINTVAKKTISKSESGNKVIITSNASEQITSNNNQETKQQKITVTWDYSNPESPVVTDINYN